MSRPLIFLSNDDGIQAPGLRAVAEAMSELGDVVIIAPATERSAMSHAITLSDPIRIKNVEYNLDGVTASACSGTPADCVKLGLEAILPRNPDLVVSGINHGGNTGVNVIYSGTVSAAAEGMILGIPSMAISVDGRVIPDFTPAKKIAQNVARSILKHGLPTGTVLNINIPNLPLDQLPPGTADGKNYNLTVHGKADWQDQFDRRIDPQNREYFWLAGRKREITELPHTDEETLKAGRVSITPLHYDLTDYKAKEALASWEIFNPPM